MVLHNKKNSELTWSTGASRRTSSWWFIIFFVTLKQINFQFIILNPRCYKFLYNNSLKLRVFEIVKSVQQLTKNFKSLKGLENKKSRSQYKAHTVFAIFMLLSTIFNTNTLLGFTKFRLNSLDFINPKIPSWTGCQF